MKLHKVLLIVNVRPVPVAILKSTDQNSVHLKLVDTCERDHKE